jgi:hypothetical protein
MLGRFGSVAPRSARPPRCLRQGEKIAQQALSVRMVWIVALGVELDAVDRAIMVLDRLNG